ncbi:Alpha/Beta hydrolase protein [Auriculariales sp. MPI-PUGE-AT-0066]|nr:Alpha/Beta hydrolase protein [Auriculariales sp. MPI-PUGE-AT-0066]
MTGIQGARDKRRRGIMLITLAGIIFFMLYVSTRAQSAPRGFVPSGYRTCERDADIECGRISVPRDYFNVSKGRTEIAVARYRTRDEPRHGTLFINAGGPGGSGVNLMFVLGKLLARLFPGYDIVGFDPRGVGLTLPAVACFPTFRDEEVFKHNTVLSQGFNVPPGDPSVPENSAAILSQMRQWLALHKAQSDMCLNATDAEDLPNMSTATVARDVAYMTTVLDGDDSLIHFWGPSYGTIIGSYLVNMFPDRIGRVSLDGVVNPWEWSNVPAHRRLGSMFDNTEEAFDYILDRCGAAGPRRCALARHTGEKGKHIAHRLDSFLDQLYDHPLVYTNSSRRGIITSGMVRALLYFSTNAPMHFATIATAVASAMDGKLSELAALTLKPFRDLATPLPGDTARNIISCLDAPPYDADRPETWPTAEELTINGINRLRTVSPRFGLSVSLFEDDGACQFFAKAAVKLPERFTGPFNQSLRNPILIVSADLDPITPLVNARWVNEQLGQSARLVIQQDTPAHSTFFLGPSLCVAKIYRRFYATGELPEAKETLCSNELKLFSDDESTILKVDEDEDPKFVDLVRELQQVMGHYFPLGLPG